MNLRTAHLEHESDRRGYRSRSIRVGDQIGATRIGGSLYELEDGEQSFPYHFHHGVEEWLLVVEGKPTVRTPTGERQLRPGDVVCFPSGPDGAHVVRGPGRILLLSANREPSISVYPDSDKLGTRPGTTAPDDWLNFRRSDAVDYWEGE
ncbi:MAG: cupin domain-containing protein [Actinobacteria bacterium]|nr:cupin domain-containing protein [Actinomycetota bacterium]